MRHCLLLFASALTPVLSGQAKPSAAMKLYTDPETGVSFRYPAALKAEAGGYYSGLSEGGEDNASAPVERLSVSWPSYEARKDDTGHVFTWYLTTYTFAYALLPEKTAKKCAARFDLKDDRYSAPKTVVLNGITFIHVSFSPEPGLGHSGEDELYTTFHRGRCLGFSLASDTYHDADKPTAAQRREAKLPGGPEETLKTVWLR